MFAGRASIRTKPSKCKLSHKFPLFLYLVLHFFFKTPLSKNPPMFEPLGFFFPNQTTPFIYDEVHSFPISPNIAIVSFESLSVVMDAVRAHNKQVNKSFKKRKNPMKVVYISSPMKVTTSVSKFRSLVQELTGRHSDVARYMEEANNATAGSHSWTDDDQLYESKAVQPMPTSRPFHDDSPTSSESFLESLGDDDFMSQIEENFASFFPPSVFYGSPMGDGLTSFGTT